MIWNFGEVFVSFMLNLLVTMRILKLLKHFLILFIAPRLSIDGFVMSMLLSSSQGDMPPADIVCRIYNLKNDLEDLINSLLSDYKLGLPLKISLKIQKIFVVQSENFLDSGFGSNSSESSFRC